MVAISGSDCHSTVSEISHLSYEYNKNIQNIFKIVAYGSMQKPQVNEKVASREHFYSRCY